MTQKIKEDLKYAFLSATMLFLFLAAIYVITPIRKEFNEKRTVILHDGMRIRTTIYHMSQWTLKSGVTIGNNDYAGAYTVLEGWK